MILPIPAHYTHHIIDNSKLSTYKQCPRMYFYRYMLGWEASRVSHNLLFGRWMHEALDVLITAKGQHQRYASAVNDAYALFVKLWQEEYGTELFEHKTKNPANALRALQEYAKRYDAIDHFDVLGIELGKSIDISVPEKRHRKIYFRVDAILEDERGVFIRDFKTASTLKGGWVAQFPCSSQLACYAYVLTCLFQGTVRGIEVDGLGFLTKEIQLHRLAFNFSLNRLENWLHNVNRWLDILDYDTMLLANTSDKDEVMEAFPMCDTACANWNRACMYQGLCMSRHNPLRWDCTKPPSDFVIRFWDPTAHEPSEPSEPTASSGTATSSGAAASPCATTSPCATASSCAATSPCVATSSCVATSAIERSEDDQN